MYAKHIKRFLDIIFSMCAIVVLSPLLLILTIFGFVKMKGNPFFTQRRPGVIGNNGKERVFRLIKFRSMTNEKDAYGKLLPDSVRLKKYGKILRKTSLDELPELINVLKGDMSIVGPRPLMERYLPYYTEEERKRHTVRPGLTGYAQIHGRNIVSWGDRISQDLYYVDHISLGLDMKIIYQTIILVFRREGTSIENMENFDDYRKRQWESNRDKPW